MNHQVELRGGHSSGQFSDTEKQQTADARRLVKRFLATDLHYLTGTEAGSRSVLGEAFEALLKPGEIGHGLAFAKGKSGDVWVLYRRDLFVGEVTVEWHKVIDGVKAMFADRGYIVVSGLCPLVASRLTLMSSHWFTDRTDFNKSDGPRNRKMAAALTEQGKEHGRGRDLVFLGIDANRQERDPEGIVLTAPFTSLATELGKIESTGHGAIDAMLSYNRDGRVSGKSWDVLNDHEFFLASDHWYTEGSFNVRV